MELLDRIQFSYNVCDQDVKDITEGIVNSVDKSVWYSLSCGHHEMFVHVCKRQGIKWLIKWQVPRKICHETLVSLVEWCTFQTSFMPGGFQQAHKWTDSGCQRLLTVNMLIYNVKSICCPLIHDISFHLWVYFF